MNSIGPMNFFRTTDTTDTTDTTIWKPGLKVALGSALNLVDISFHSFEPILEKDFLLISVFDFWI